MKIVSALLFSGVLLAAGQFVHAAEQGVEATLRDPHGKVLMNKGSGLVSAKAGAELKDGDRVVTLDKSDVRIVFSDGCDVYLEENKIFVIDTKLGCKALPVASTPAAPVAGLTTTQGLLIGAAVVGGGAIIIGNGSSNNNDNRPISNQ